MAFMTEGTKVRFVRWRDKEDDEFKGNEGSVYQTYMTCYGLQYDVQFDCHKPGDLTICYEDEIEEVL